MFSFKKSQFQTKPTLVALTQDSLLFYDSVPQNTDEWLQSTHFYSLLTTRLVVQSSSSSNSVSRINFNLFNDYSASSASALASSSDANAYNCYFLTRHGTTRGIQSHLFKCRTFAIGCSLSRSKQTPQFVSLNMSIFVS